MQVTVDFSKVQLDCINKDIHSLLKEKLDFPDYYGFNLDALYDVLLDTHEKWEIRFTGCRRLWQNNALFMEKLRETFTDAAAEGAAVSAEWYA